MDCIATFEDAQMAILFDKMCRNMGFACRVVPVPKGILGSCGLACRFKADEAPMIRQLALEHSIEVLDYHFPDQ
ncbi:MAG: DUF3343 domain-containing protein [Thermovirgaceae bacterium]|nr:DUF3343 domain-containing protein [Synergistales bacterium]